MNTIQIIVLGIQLIGLLFTAYALKYGKKY